MAVSVSPTSKTNTHHVALTQGGVKVGLILCDGNGNADRRTLSRNPMPRQSLKFYQGDAAHSDMEPPWTPMDQKDWSGGRGRENLDEATNMFYDSWRAYTARTGEIVSGGMEIFTSGYRPIDFNWPWKNSLGNGIVYSWVPMYGYNDYYAMKFRAGSSYTPKSLLVIAKKTGSPTVSQTIGIYTVGGGGTPGTKVGDVTVSFNPDSLAATYLRLNISSASAALTAGTDYFLVFDPNGTHDANNHFSILCSWETIYTDSYGSDDGTTWIATAYKPFFVLGGDEDPFKAHLFQYKGALYAALEYDDNGASKVFINGDRGVATGGTATTLTDSTKSWPTNKHVGRIVEITGGTGSDGKKRYGMITANTGTELTVTGWTVTPAAGSEYVILGADDWTEVGGTNPMTVSVKDTLASRDIAYFAMGDNNDLVRLRQYNSSGWTQEWVTESGNKASFLKAVPDESTGALEIWRGNKGLPSKISVAPSIDGSGTGPVANLTFGSDIPVGDTADQITGFNSYGLSKKRLWVFKEAGIYEIQSDIPVEHRLTSLASVRDPRNGAVSMVNDVYLYFSIHNKWQRNYDNNIDDIGPDNLAGLPSDRQGDISAAVAHAGRHFIAINGGPYNYSSVVLYNEQGWHEFYRAPAKGLEIKNIYIQSLPGNKVDRMWISMGSDIIWVPVAWNPANYVQADFDFYPFTHESHVISPYIYINLMDVHKFFYSLKVMAERLSTTTGQTVYAEYRVDNGTTWVPVTGPYNELFSEEKLFSENYDVTGKRLQYRLRLVTNRNQLTPRVLATVVETITRVPIKYTSTFQFRVQDRDQNLIGQLDDMDADTKINHLKNFASSPLPVLVESDDDQFHNKLAFMESIPLRVSWLINADGTKREILTATLLEI